MQWRWLLSNIRKHSEVDTQIEMLTDFIVSHRAAVEHELFQNFSMNSQADRTTFITDQFNIIIAKLMNSTNFNFVIDLTLFFLLRCH